MNSQQTNEPIKSELVNRPWLTIFSLSWPLVMGIVVALLFHEYWYIPHVGLGSVERSIRFGRLLDQPFPQDKLNVIALGNSITYEGLDAQLANQVSGDAFRVWNCAIGGCTMSEQKLMLPKILSAKPRAIVISMQPEYMKQVDDLSDYKCYAYAYSKFTKYWPADWTDEQWPNLSSDNLIALHSNRWQQVAYFRNAPLNNLNQLARRSVRAELQESAPDNWINPHEMTASLRDQRLNEHIQRVRASILQRFGRETDVGKKLIRNIVEYIRANQVQVIVVCLPIHPLLQNDYTANNWAEYRQFCDELVEKYKVQLLDVSKLLDESEFADALHPNEAGRIKYSVEMGKAISKLPQTSEPKTNP